MKLSIKKLFTILLLIAVVSSLILSSLSLYFNNKIVKNQFYLSSATKVYNAGHAMNKSLMGFFSRQQNILIANNMSDFSKIQENTMLHKQFNDELKNLTKIALDYPELNEPLANVQSLYKTFNTYDKSLYESKRSQLLAEASLENKIDEIDSLLNELLLKSNGISGKLILDFVQTKQEIIKELRDPKSLETLSGQMKFKTSVSQLILSNSANAQQIIKSLNNKFSDLSEMVWKIMSTTNPDKLKDLEGNKLEQLTKSIDEEFIKLKTMTNSNPEFYQTIEDMEEQFEVIETKIMLDPKNSIIKGWYEVYNKQTLTNESIKNLQIINANIIAQFSILNDILNTIKDKALTDSEDSLRLNRIAMFTILTSILVVLFLLGSYFLRTLTKSLSNLTATMMKISTEEGNLNLQVKEMPFQELNVVGLAFNTMTHKLQYTYAHLEDLVKVKTFQLTEANKILELDIQKRIEMEKKVAELNQNLIMTARQAGMADVATSVLHNVGNALNSIVVSLNVLQQGFKNPNFSNLVSISAMISEHSNQLDQYLAHDEKGKLIPQYLTTLIRSLNAEREQLANEVLNLEKNVRHIQNIILRQQSVGRKTVVESKIFLPDVLETAIQMCNFSEKDKITIEKDFKIKPFIVADESKLIQILLNLLINAKDSLNNAHDIPDKSISIKIDKSDSGSTAAISISDNGSGIQPENLTKIFSFGFTTKPTGHGFGLHGSALSAKELGGNLQASSKGIGHGATFTLTLPLSTDS